MRSAKVQLQFDRQIAAREHGWANPVVPGDHPDPTIIRVGRTYWASATSGEWSPQFPLFRSVDLRTWQPAGAIFPEQPAWAEGSFWAPELVHDELSGKFLVWYVGKKRGGPLCIAVASAPAADGPYTDHGPLICEWDGSIDPCFARDEHGEPYLIWKEDGNSAGRSTPIWCQPLSEDLLELRGEKTELITNDQSWEEGVVEGPYILRHLDCDGIMRFYMFYAGNSCCGKECKYAEGVARAERLLGPWEKGPANPLIGANDRWRCPGHGTAVHAADGKGPDYLLYHAYPAGGTIYVGREAVLDEIDWPAELAGTGEVGWPSVNAGTGPGEPAEAQFIDFTDDFTASELGASWQWPVNTRPEVQAGEGRLRLGIPPESRLAQGPVESAMVAVPRPVALHYEATVTLLLAAEPEERLWAGLSVVGDPFNTIGLGVRGEHLVVWARRGNWQGEVGRVQVPSGRAVRLRVESFGEEHHVRFAFASEDGDFQDIGEPWDASDLPAWDRGLRIGLMLEGPCGSAASFERFTLRAEE